MHLRTVEAVAEVVLTGLIMLRILIVGFLREPGQVLSWPMYTRRSSAVVELTVDHGTGPVPVNPYDLLVLGSTALSTADVQDVHDFLARDGARVELTGYVLWEQGRSELRLRDGRVEVWDGPGDR
jgi:hypothetical protein